ncbi:MAG: segregation/condensation protein A, partial [Syntrophales bacterium]|nr:segregation/condensation protein A [Syntrophales bacterium]
MDYEVKLDIFEGPLDLLLYLIRKNEIDITDIPIALITQQYLEYLEMMKALNLDLAGEYLVLASTLLHIKSRMLLPTADPEDGAEEEGPRRELVEQLLEYQAVKEAALALDSRAVLERDVFKRGKRLEDGEAADEAEEMVEIGIFELVEAFQRCLNRLVPPGSISIEMERITMAERLEDILARPSNEGEVMFFDLFEG